MSDTDSIARGDLVFSPHPTEPGQYVLARVTAVRNGMVERDSLLRLPTLKAAFFFRDAEFPHRDLWIHESLRTDQP